MSFEAAGGASTPMLGAPGREPPAQSQNGSSPAWVHTLGLFWTGFVALLWVFAWLWFGSFGCHVNGYPGCESDVGEIWGGLGIAMPVMGMIAISVGRASQRRWVGWLTWFLLTLAWFAAGTVAWGTIDYQP